MVAAALAACGSDAEPTVIKVFKAPPWTAAEHYSYDLRDAGDKLNGTCELKTTPDKEPGKTFLEHLCGNQDGDRDDRGVLVDAQTLAPITGSRTIYDVKKNKRTVFTSSYEPPVVKLKADENGDVHTTERDVPTPTKDSPDPGYYDDESLFWVVRGVPLEKGWEGAYKDVNASNGRIFTATVKVEKSEKVDVPAGSFTAWKIRLQTESITQYFWVDTNAPHAIIKASIEAITYKLTSTN
jgi:hypothetical protein